MAHKWRVGVTDTEAERLEDFVDNNNLTATTLSSPTMTTPTLGDATADSLTVNNDLKMSGTTGEGIKLPSTFGYHDIMGEIEVRGVGSNDPTWAQVGATAFYAYKFAVGDELWINYHVPHDYVPGTDIYIHTHWFPDGTNTAEVKWQYTYTYAKGHNQAAYDFAGTTVTAAEAPPGTQYQHMVTESSAITISGLEVDGMIKVHIKRIANGGTDNTDGIFVDTCDVHYQSTGLPTQNRAPDFYS